MFVALIKVGNVSCHHLFPLIVETLPSNRVQLNSFKVKTYMVFELYLIIIISQEPANKLLGNSVRLHFKQNIYIYFQKGWRQWFLN